MPPKAQRTLFDFQKVKKDTTSTGKTPKGGKTEPAPISSTSTAKPTTSKKPSVVIEKKQPLKRRRDQESEESEPEPDDDEQDFIEILSEEELPVAVVPEVALADDVESSEHAEGDEDPITSPNVKGKEVSKGMKELLKDKEFNDAYKVAQKAIAGELTASKKSERKATTILRVWDLSYEYGPCVGLTRMERWNRADKRGLNPPQIVRLILETGKADNLQDEELTALEESVFHGMV